MKFTKKEAVEKLTAKLTNGGKKPLRMSVRSLEEQTEDLMSLLDDDEMELDAFVGKVQKQFERFNSNVEHDVADGVKKALETKEPTEKKDGEDGRKEDRVAKLLERVEALEKEREDALNRSVADSKRKELKSQLSKKNVDENWLDNILDLVPLDKDSDVETVGTSLLERYNKMMASRGGEFERTPDTPSGGGDKQKDSFGDVAELRKASQTNLQV